jgi:hypothetical protein
LENVVGIRIVDRHRGEVGYLAWGRIDDPVDPEPLLTRIRRCLPEMGFHDVAKVELCYDLGELQAHRYFYEALVLFSARYAEVLLGKRSLDEIAHSDEAFRKSLYLLGPARPNRLT